MPIDPIAKPKRSKRKVLELIPSDPIPAPPEPKGLTLQSLLDAAKTDSAKPKNQARVINIRITYNGQSYLLKFANGLMLPALEPTQ